MFAVFALALTVTPPALDGACAPSVVQPAVQAAAEALKRKDVAAAKAAIAPAAACPVRDGPSYAAHVLGADVASRAGDWATVRNLLDGVRILPEAGIGAHTEFLRLTADQGLGDAAAFARDRTAMLAANDRGLAAAGRRVETFQAGGAQVSAYEATVDQGSFHRVLEFVIAPDAPFAYPASILLTDDQGAIGLFPLPKSQGSGEAAHAWFLDLYTCSSHSTLPPPAAPSGAQAGYAEVKARVIATLSASPPIAAPATPPAGGCWSAGWILPGFGAKH